MSICCRLARRQRSRSSTQQVSSPFPMDTAELIFGVLEEYTRIIFSLADETITIDREESTLSHDVQTSPEIGSHTLLQFGEKREYLSLRIFFDVSAIEVYANDRFAMSSRVYPASIGPMAVSISAAAASRSSGPIGRIIQSAVWQR